VRVEGEDVTGQVNLGAGADNTHLHDTENGDQFLEMGGDANTPPNA
jgi:hypothetical protein